MNATLALAMEKLRERDPQACDLFGSIAREHEVREAWLGLALANHFCSETELAVEALGRALSRHAVSEVPPLADEIVAAAGALGWCALTGAGLLTVRLVGAAPDGVALLATLDGKKLRLRGLRPDRRTFSARLPDGWLNAAGISVCLDDVDLIGSPIAITAIVRVEGFVDTKSGDLHGWAWCPNDPDRELILSIDPIDGGPGLRVVADDTSVSIATRTPLARPRGFRVPAEKLGGISGPVWVRGQDGRNLVGSPLDPAAERRSAVAAAQAVASWFPASGPVSLSKKRLLDVVIPVYGGLKHTLDCLDSVLADLPKWARVVVVDDASPEPVIGEKLQALAARRRITLLTQSTNRGFPATANIGMRHDDARDVVLLNSDTLVPPGWLTRLREAAYAAPDIGSATPLSNEATILSYPSVEQVNEIPDLSETISLDAMAQAANAGCLIDIPTAIGFCVYIRRDCLNATGLLREDVFAQGYGEENDFCRRAHHLGWRHVAVPGVFVGHIGGQSFGAAKHHLIERNLRRLNRLHPDYEDLINSFNSADPLAAPRRRLDQERWKANRSRKRSVLLVTHGRAGGVKRHIAERSEALQQDGLRPIILWPAASRDGTGSDCVVGEGPKGGTPNLRFSIPGELAELTRFLKADHPVRAEVHHLIGHDHRILELFTRLGIPYDMIVHDYALLCPRISLVGPDRRYCGEPDLAGCETCIRDVGPLNGETISAPALRGRSAAELASAAAVIVPSQDVATRFRRYFPSVLTKLGTWGNDDTLPPSEVPSVPADGIRRVCVVGAIGVEKGYDILLACARDAANRKLALKFHLVGHSSDDARLLATGVVEITGGYDEYWAIELIRRQRAQLAWLTSIWPETWSYTLTQAWSAGLRVLAFDIGAPAERIRHTGRGWLCPLGLSPQGVNRLLLEKTANLEFAA